MLPRIEKLCNESSWVLTHPKFTRLNDIVRIEGDEEDIYRVISFPFWDEVNKEFSIKLEKIEERENKND